MDIFAWSILDLSQSLDSNMKVEAVGDQLSFSHSASKNLNTQSCAQSLLFVQLATNSKDVGLEVSDLITFQQVSLPQVYFITVDQFLFIWNEGIRETKSPLNRQSIVLSQSATVSKSKGTANILNLTQSINLSYIRGLTVTSNLTVISEVAGYLPSKYWTSFPITVVEP